MSIPTQDLRDALDAKEFVVHRDAEMLAAAVAQRIVVLAAQAIAARGAFRIALAGGNTPRRCYELLRDMAVDWQRVHVYYGDERCLPRGDPGRNDSMAQQAWLDHVAVPADNVHAIPAELGAEAAAAEYAKLLEPALPLDIVLLGMGEDGHTASLFPGNPATEQEDAVVAVFDAPKPPPQRVSLGMPTLNAAREKIFLVAGEGKREALGKIARGIALPAARIARAEWHVDGAALPGEIVSGN